ncbi:S1C family serine protease [Arcanobacterium bovis]|uniref:PDZ domain-containing protein n=1 Tax=Arcanobacterium bovis TaxID=2529275 RepID=A0A4Q9UZR0_9ACTO|nr:trypsin-like peptidase domain-containing protein [Arcanobacterium bovis]TBW21519.1 PDZ domain-containing protein [Arcanobacterium bovis]
MNDEKMPSNDPVAGRQGDATEELPSDAQLNSTNPSQSQDSLVQQDSGATPKRPEVSQRPVIINYGANAVGSVHDDGVENADGAEGKDNAEGTDNAANAQSPMPVTPQTNVPTDEHSPTKEAGTESLPQNENITATEQLGVASAQATSAQSEPEQPAFSQATPASSAPTQPVPMQQAPTQANPSLGTAWMYAPNTEAPEDSKKGKKKSRPGWAALIAVGVVAALAGGGLGVGAMTLRYDGSRPVSVSEGKPNIKPVVDAHADAPDWGAVAKTVGPAVVAINVDSRQGEAAGSGVIFDKAGHILTNNHVVAGAEKITVTLSDGRVIEAKTAGTDPATDLAVLTLATVPQDITVAAMGDSSQVKVGDPVAAIGNPLGLSSTMTTGIVSALNRPVQTAGANQQTGERTRVVTNAIQIDAAVNPGNSGGPIFDAQGRVIGIASSIASISGGGAQAGSIGLGFAIPINLAENIAKQLVEKGVAEHAFLGVSIVDGIAQYKGMSKLGAEVKSVEDGTPAAAAHIQVGDVITAVNGNPVTSAASLTGYTRQHRSGEKVTLTFERNGELQETDVTLATRQDTQK